MYCVVVVEPWVNQLPPILHGYRDEGLHGADQGSGPTGEFRGLLSFFRAYCSTGKEKNGKLNPCQLFKAIGHNYDARVIWIFDEPAVSHDKPSLVLVTFYF